MGHALSETAEHDEGFDLVQKPQTDLIVPPLSVPQYLEKTSEFLSLLSEATQDTFEGLALPTDIFNKNSEVQVRKGFAAQTLLERSVETDELALDSIIAGGTAEEIEFILDGVPFAEAIEDTAASVLETRAAKWLVDQGLMNEERATKVINEEFSPEGLKKVSSTDLRQDFITTMLKFNTLRGIIAEKLKDDSIGENVLDFLAIMIPFHQSVTSAKVFGRDVERLGTSIKGFSDKFWALPLKERLETLNQFGEDIQNNTLTGENLLSAGLQLEQLLSFTDEDKLAVNLIETLDTALIGVPLVKLFKAFKTISVVGRAAGFKDITPGRALILRDRDRGFGFTIEGEFADITPVGRAALPRRGALTVIEEDELIENIIPSMASLETVPEKGVGTTQQAMEIMDISELYQKLLPTLGKVIGKLGDDVDLEVLNPVDLLAILRGTVVPEVLNEVEQGAANIAAIKAILKRFGVPTEARALVDPERYTGGAISTKVYPVYDVDIDNISGLRTVNVFLGTGEGLTKGFTSLEAAEAGAERLGISKGFFEVSEKTGEFFIKVSRNPGTTQYISPIDPSEIPRTAPVLSRALAGKATTSTLDDIKGARLSESAETILMTALVKAAKAINPRTTPKGPGLSPKAKKVYDELMMDIQQSEKWMTTGQMDEWYQKHHQRLPTEREKLAYSATKQIYAFDYLIRNNRLKGELVGAGYQEGMITGLFKSPTILKEVATTSLPPRQVRIYDAVKKEMVRVRDEVELRELLKRSDTLVLVKNLTRSKNFGDYIIVSKEDLNIRPLRAQVLNKVDGPHRIYDGQIFIKQQRIRNIGGTETLVNPKTHFVVKGITEGKKFVDDYNAALSAYNVARISGTALDKAFASDFINKKTTFSSYSEMEKAIEEGRLELTPFEALKSGERPTYRVNEITTKAIDEDFLNFSEAVQDLIQNGRLFYSKRGPHLRHPDGSLAPLVHPDKILAMASRNAVGTQSYTPYKIRQTTRWVNTYNKYLVPQPGWGVAQKFLYGTFDRASNAPVPMSATTHRNAVLQRDGIKRLLKNRGVLAETVNRYRDQIIDIIDGRANANVADRAANIMSADPVVALRGMAFKAFLGFGDISQLIVQTSMTPGVIAIAPIEGAISMGLYPLMRAVMFNPKHTKFLSKLVRHNKLMKPEVFETMMKDLETSGVSIIGRNLGDLDAMSNEGQIMSLGGAFLRRSTDGAMFFFNEAEKFVRVLGFTIAWQENFAKTGKGLTTPDEFATVMVRGIALAGNMTRAEKAWWQEGILGLATQFTAQPLRLAELMLLETPGGFVGKGLISPKDFGKDKARWYLGLALAFGPTLGLRGDQSAPGSVTEYIKQKYFEETGEEINETLLRGFTDGIVGLMLPDTDISRLQPFGQGTLLSEFFDTEKGIDIWNMVGASGSMISRFYNSTIGSAKLWAFISADIDVDLIPLTLVDIANDIGKTLVSYSRVQKAIHSYQTGEFISSRGDFLQRDVDHFDAAMIGLGFPPMKSSAAREAGAFLKDYKEKVLVDARQAAQFFMKAMKAEEGSRVERLNLAYVDYLKNLHHITDLDGDGGRTFALAFDKFLSDNKTLTEKVRERMNRVLFRDPKNLQ